MQRPLLAVVGGVELRMIFRSFEIRQDIFVIPSGITQRCPLVVVGPIAAYIGHRIGAATSAQGFATGQEQAPVVEVLLRL